MYFGGRTAPGYGRTNANQPDMRVIVARSKTSATTSSQITVLHITVWGHMGAAPNQRTRKRVQQMRPFWSIAIFGCCSKPARSARAASL